MAKAFESIAVRGSGFVPWMAALALRSVLPERIAVRVVDFCEPPVDYLYGFILPPEIYPFHLDVGVSEPELILETSASFVYGTHYTQWGEDAHDWMQVFHQPLPIWDGVEFHRVVAATDDTTLQDTLIAASAARSGRFAHPPEASDHPLSRAEYGYAIEAAELAEFYKAKALAAGIDVDAGGAHDAGTTYDLMVDCDIPKLGKTDGLAVSLERDPSIRPIQPVQDIEGTTDGWMNSVVTRAGRMTLRVSRAGVHADEALHREHTHSKPWSGNAVAIGNAARVRLPLTVSPMRLLLRDIDRLTKLIPITTDMEVEAREYNAGCQADVQHADLFDAALSSGIVFADGHPLAPGTPNTKLARKLEAYSASAYLVMYDHEPFDVSDWAILHDGIGRRPRRIGALARSLEPDASEKALRDMRGTIASVVSKMPPFPVYMDKFTDYLKRKHAGHDRH